VTDEQLDAYAERIEPIRDAYHSEQYRLEQYAAAGLKRDLCGLGGIHEDVISFIERRWTLWLDARLRRLLVEYQLDAERIRKEVGID